jgi:hypothetical protein
MTEELISNERDLSRFAAAYGLWRLSASWPDEPFSSRANAAAIIFKHANPAGIPSRMLSLGSLLMVRSSFV